MKGISNKYGNDTLVNHFAEGDPPHHSHVMPIDKTSLFSCSDHATGVAIYDGSMEGSTYARKGNPNPDIFPGRSFYWRLLI